MRGAFRSTPRRTSPCPNPYRVSTKCRFTTCPQHRPRIGVRGKLRSGRPRAATGSSARFLRAGRRRPSTTAICLSCCSPGAGRSGRCWCTCRKPARHVRHRSARARRPPGPAAQRARSVGGRHRRPQDSRSPRHPHGAGRTCPTPCVRPSAATTRSSSIAAPSPGIARSKNSAFCISIGRTVLISRRVPPERLRLPHAGLSPGDLHARCLELQASAIVAVH